MRHVHPGSRRVACTVGLFPSRAGAGRRRSHSPPRAVAAGFPHRVARRGIAWRAARRCEGRDRSFQSSSTDRLSHCEAQRPATFSSTAVAPANHGSSLYARRLTRTFSGVRAPAIGPLRCTTAVSRRRIREDTGLTLGERRFRPRHCARPCKKEPRSLSAQSARRTIEWCGTCFAFTLNRRQRGVTRVIASLPPVQRQTFAGSGSPPRAAAACGANEKEENRWANGSTAG